MSNHNVAVVASKIRLGAMSPALATSKVRLGAMAPAL